MCIEGEGVKNKGIDNILSKVIAENIEREREKSYPGSGGFRI
jgi:hypothetical protein